MTDKEFVSMEQRVCIVCGQTYDTGTILLDKRLQRSMEHSTVTGYGLCDEHKRLFNEGYVALVAIDPQRSKPQPNGAVKPGDEYRTGEVAFLKRPVYARIFKVDVPAHLPMVFTDSEVIEHLRQMTTK